ncbi:MAG: SCP2 sterol-binding domain-containing protein [Gallionella sp.]
MELPAFNFPGPLAMLVSLLPTYPPSFAFTSVLNLALDRIVLADNLQPLHGRQIAIQVNDLGLRLDFIIADGKFIPARHAGVPDLVISATSRDFYLLATRREDPDTLFFSRRLVVEGETELGLIAKNTLDAVELPKLDAALSPRKLMAGIRWRLLQR